MQLLVDGPARARATLVLAHGSGAPMDSPFLAALVAALVARRVRIVRFEFPYMAARRDGGPRRPPDPMPRLEAAFRDALRTARVRPARVAIGGKSLGGRVATRIADDIGCRAVVVFGYPFHPPGRPERLRTEHLQTLRTPCLVLQGERDPFGGPAAGEGLAPALRVVPIPDGDHGFAPRVRSGRSLADNLEFAADTAAAFLGRPTPG